MYELLITNDTNACSNYYESMQAALDGAADAAGVHRLTARSAWRHDAAAAGFLVDDAGNVVFSFKVTPVTEYLVSAVDGSRTMLLTEPQVRTFARSINCTWIDSSIVDRRCQPVYTTVMFQIGEQQS